MILYPAHAVLEFADEDSVAHNGRMVLGDGLTQTGKAVLQIV